MTPTKATAHGRTRGAKRTAEQPVAPALAQLAALAIRDEPIPPALAVAVACELDYNRDHYDRGPGRLADGKGVRQTNNVPPRT